MRCWDTSKAYQTESELTLTLGFLWPHRQTSFYCALYYCTLQTVFFANGNLCKIW